jgi:hypothetical protein
MSTTFLRPDPTNDKQMAEAKARFEAMYGVNATTRTPAQGKALVDTYGKKFICQTDKITPKQLRDKMKKGSTL